MVAFIGAAAGAGVVCGDGPPISKAINQARGADACPHAMCAAGRPAGVEPTGKKVRVPFVVVVKFEGDKVCG